MKYIGVKEFLKLRKEEQKILLSCMANLPTS